MNIKVTYGTEGERTISVFHTCLSQQSSTGLSKSLTGALSHCRLGPSVVAYLFSSLHHYSRTFTPVKMSTIKKSFKEIKTLRVECQHYKTFLQFSYLGEFCSANRHTMAPEGRHRPVILATKKNTTTADWATRSWRLKTQKKTRKKTNMNMLP